METTYTIEPGFRVGIFQIGVSATVRHDNKLSGSRGTDS